MAVSDGMNYITLREVIDDFIITMDGDDYVSHASDSAIRNVGLRGIREFGFDVTARIKSLKRTIESKASCTCRTGCFRRYGSLLSNRERSVSSKHIRGTA